ncbi:metalloregulator ArsR/SmtB family transcription factor [Brachyspira intermedia]|uniref:ArsR/SmtB family transcription factor n=1 Tax=Brachyspira intermedia TaxID=84377 RepID=UPI00300691BE
MKNNIKKDIETSDEEYLNNDDDCEISTKDSNISSLIPKLPNDEEFSLLAGFFSVFSDPTRLKIISALSEKELCVHELSSLLDMKQPSISQHLKMLWQARVVKKRKVGLHVFYRLDDEHIEKIYTWGYEHVKE